MSNKIKKTRTLPLREAKARLSAAINEVQEGSVLIITRHGAPAAVLVGVKGLDLLDVARRFEKFVRI